MAWDLFELACWNDFEKGLQSYRGRRARSVIVYYMFTKRKPKHKIVVADPLVFFVYAYLRL
jgi:hypothetical protein